MNRKMRSRANNKAAKAKKEIKARSSSDLCPDCGDPLSEHGKGDWVVVAVELVPVQKDKLH